MRTTTSYTNDFTDLTNNTSSTNSVRGLRLINDAIRYLVNTFFFNESTYVVPGGTLAGIAAYQLPFNNKQVINTTVSIGAILWQPTECATRAQYDALNVIAFQNDYPQFYYIYNSQLLLWPAPASSNDPITINYKRRLRDLSAADYTTGTVTVTNASTAVVGSSTNWTTNMANRWLNVPATTSNSTSGDDEWYQIASVTDATHLVLYNQYQGATATSVSAGYTIGEVPILPEDFQDLALYRAFYIYFSSIKKDEDQAKYFMQLYEDGYKMLDAEFGSKTASVGLTPLNTGVVNPNMYQTSISHT